MRGGADLHARAWKAHGRGTAIRRFSGLMT